MRKVFEPRFVFIKDQLLHEKYEIQMKIQNGTLRKSNAFTTHPKEKY